MIGDAPALTQSSIGISIGDGTDIAIESSDIILTNNNLLNILLKNLSNIIYINFFWAFIFNIICTNCCWYILSKISFYTSTRNCINCYGILIINYLTSSLLLNYINHQIIILI